MPVNCIGNLKLFNKDSKTFYMLEAISKVLYVLKENKYFDCVAIFSATDICFQDIKTEQNNWRRINKEWLLCS